MRYTIFGGSGFLGNELVKRLDGDLLVVARNEGNLVALKEKHPRIEIMVGDVSDPYVCDRACKDADGIYNLSALKHVGLAEQNVKQAIESNIPIALLEATRKYKPKFIIGISTDKAASRKGVYGTTKFLMERLFSEYEKLNPNTKYRIVRYGNVLYSTGSVLTKWKDKILKGEEVIITEPTATRFFWTVEQAVDLIFECLEEAIDSTPYITSMKSMEMGDLLDAMIEKYAQGKKIPIKEIGLQSGENMHEIITEDGIDSSETEQFTIEEIMQLI
jgi:UDP-N-acetylglucosamine 4,6-dehydratase/UDP-glucose 4-epimerase